eukprot:4688975-Amphidinium_carterae.1
MSLVARICHPTPPRGQDSTARKRNQRGIPWKGKGKGNPKISEEASSSSCKHLNLNSEFLCINTMRPARRSSNL